MPVTLELSQRSAWASSVSVVGSSGLQAHDRERLLRREPELLRGAEHLRALREEDLRASSFHACCWEDGGATFAIGQIVAVDIMVDNLKYQCSLSDMSLAASAGIEVEGLVREFKNGPRAVDGIDLQVAPGEIYGFLGPNGAGKSTTVLMLTTLLPPTAGTARVAGHDILREGPAVRGVDRRRAAGGGARPAADRRATTCACRRRCRALPKAQRRARGDELIERVGLTDAADRKVGGYSGGMKRRLDLALALVHSPRVLFLDEPTTGPRSLQPRRPVGRGRAARARGRRDRLPHDAVPRGGRRAGRPRRDHRRRARSSPRARRRR